MYFTIQFKLRHNKQEYQFCQVANVKGYGDIVTVYHITNEDACDNTVPLNEFDYAVFSACLSYFDKSYRCIFLGIIYHAMTGKTTEGGKRKVPPEIREFILLSLKKLIGTIIEIDDAQVNAAFDYAKSGSKKCSAILPAWFVESTTINGNNATVIFFERECPLLKLAKAKRQIITYPTELLDVPGQQNTFMNISLKNYAMSRVQEIKLHNMQPTPTEIRIRRSIRQKKKRRQFASIRLFSAADFFRSDFLRTVDIKLQFHADFATILQGLSAGLLKRIFFPTVTMHAKLNQKKEVLANENQHERSDRSELSGNVFGAGHFACRKIRLRHD